MRVIESCYKDVPVLVTGGCGFIGSRLVRTLLTLGASVTILDSELTGSLKSLHDIQDNIIYINKSITDPHACLEATQGKKMVFHAAALASVPLSIDNPSLCHQINVEGTFNLLEASRLQGVERFIFSSSAAVYGNHAGVCDEQQICVPDSTYGYSKLLGELYCQQYARVYGLQTISLRYFNVYSQGHTVRDCQASVVGVFRQKLQNNEPIIMYGDGTQTRDFVAIDQVVEANVTLGMLGAEHMNGDVYNIATGTSMTLLELVDLLRKEYPLSTSSIIFKEPRPGDRYQSIANCSKYVSIMQHVCT